jgi:NADP-dependent 3-hydroxy acid dehydrogenase YdfG
MIGIEGKTVAITGARSGMGEATARTLAAAGARVILGSRNGRLERLAGEIASAGGIVRFHALDVTQCCDVAAFVNFART